MLIVENDKVLYDVKHVKVRDIAHHHVVCVNQKVSYGWYLLIGLAGSINMSNLLYYRNDLGIHSYLIIGLILLYLRHLIVDFLLEDHIHYDVIKKIENEIHVEYSDVNDFDYLNDIIKPRFDMFTIIKVVLRYIMYVLFAYYLMEFIVGFNFNNRLITDLNEPIVSLILTLALFVSSYLSFDFDYSDYHYFLNFSLCCFVSMTLIQFTLFENILLYLMIVVLLGLMFYCLYQSKHKYLLKIIILFFCMFSQYVYLYSYIHDLLFFKIYK